MTTKSRNTPLTRLSRIGLVLGIGSTQVTGNGNSQGGDDSYIPYNGPYEPPTTSHEIHGYWDSGEDTILDARSFSHLSTNGGKTHGSISTSRRYSDASKLTLSNVMTEPRRRFGRVRQNSTPMLGTYVNLDQGGIGDTPVPVHRSTSTKRRDSVFRSQITDLRKGFSKSGNRHGKTHRSEPSLNDRVPRPATSPYVYGLASHHSKSNSSAIQQPDPFAASSSWKTPVQSQKSGHAKPPQKEVSAHLQPSSHPTLLKTSLSTPDLRSTSRQRQQATHVKTKTNWLSAETWCDAFMFPRPRFLLRHMGDEPATPMPRLVSPAESIVSGQIEASAVSKPLKKSLSVSELRGPSVPKVPPSRADKDNPPISSAPKSSAPRPKSFALDDLALPSPVPSLMTVLAERQNLQNERQMWQSHATNSIGNRHTRSLSRSKSLGRTRKRSYRRPPGGTVDFLVERTLLGHQALPSTVHAAMDLSTMPVQTVTGEGQATRSSGPTSPPVRSKSHGHSKSVGAIRDSPGHRRGGSVSSALRCAQSTAAGFCSRADGTSTPPEVLDPFSEKGNINLSDRQKGATSPHSVVLVSPFTNQPRISPLSSHRVSPTLSSQNQSKVGIAISSPLPPEEHNDEPVTLPTHPYAQGANNHYSAPVNSTSLPETTHHRQPIVHPYAIHSAHPLSPQWVYRDQTVSAERTMFAEVSTGHLREIRPEEIKYSPYVEDAPKVFTTAHAIHRSGSIDRQIGDTTPRWDDDLLRMSDALNLSLRNRRSSSTDSGVGASEDPHPYGPQPERTVSSRSNRFPLPQVNEVLGAGDDGDDEIIPRNQWSEPSTAPPQSHSDDSDPKSLHAIPSGQVHSSVFAGPPTPMYRMESSGSSPGLSNDSSPPLTPRPLGRLDDLERFQDLFYNPSVNRPESPPVPGPEDQRFATGPVNLARNRSQLTTLVRQLSEDLNELRNEEGVAEDDNQPTASAGGSDGSSSVLGSTHLFLSTVPSPHPLDHPIELSHDNFPEDVQSETSSLSDRIPEEDYNEITETLRLGNVEAVSTPPPISSTLRLSGHVALVDDTTSPASRAIPSSSLVLPLCGLARTSNLTIDSGGSRISGLSEFPRPPSEQSADILASYFAQQRDDDDMPELISATLQRSASLTSESRGEWTDPL